MSLIDSLLKRELVQAQSELATAVALADKVPELTVEVLRIQRAIAALDEPIPYVLNETIWCTCGHQSKDHGPGVCAMCPCTKFTPCQSKGTEDTGAYLYYLGGMRLTQRQFDTARIVDDETGQYHCSDCHALNSAYGPNCGHFAGCPEC